MDSLKKTYNKFLSYEKKRFLEDSGFWFGVSETKKDKKIKIYDNYYKISFYRFLFNLKNLIFSDNPFDYIEKGIGDDWEMERYLSFLKKEKLIEVSKQKIVIKNKNFFKKIPKFQNIEEIKEKIEKRTRKKIIEKNSVISFINEFNDFEITGNLDQMPISLSSAMFSVKKILDYIPLNEKFLFIGDDDFLSVFLCLADSDIKAVVVDADKKLLECIDSISLKFNLKIETRLADTRKKSIRKENFVGFWCNPPYTEKGIKSFVEYGLKHLGENGGNAFVVFDNENIGNRIIFLQDYFTKKKLALMEIVSEKISYPYPDLNNEDNEDIMIKKKLKEYFSETDIRKNVKLGAKLWIFNYIPFKFQKIETDDSIYSYL